MEKAKKHYYDKRGSILVNNLKKRHFDAVYCQTKEDALKQALEYIPDGALRKGYSRLLTIPTTSIAISCRFSPLSRKKTLTNFNILGTCFGKLQGSCEGGEYL